MRIETTIHYKVMYHPSKYHVQFELSHNLHLNVTLDKFWLIERQVDKLDHRLVSECF